jgi:hypothetical protein
MPPLPDLRRAWFAVGIPGYREAGAFQPYGEFPIERLPPIERDLDNNLQWLAREPPVSDWAIFNKEAVRDFDVHRTAIWSARSTNIPAAFDAFLSAPEIGRRVRSFTGCYIDFGWRIVPASDGGTLIHFLSDQQWVAHWSLYVGPDGSEAVVASLVPYGFADPAVDKDQSAAVATFDVTNAHALVCAESFNEFLYRYWIENEICFRLQEGGLNEEQQRYLDHASHT